MLCAYVSSAENVCITGLMKKCIIVIKLLESKYVHILVLIGLIEFLSHLSGQTM